MVALACLVAWWPSCGRKVGQKLLPGKRGNHCDAVQEPSRSDHGCPLSQTGTETSPCSSEDEVDGPPLCTPPGHSGAHGWLVSGSPTTNLCSSAWATTCFLAAASCNLIYLAFLEDVIVFEKLLESHLETSSLPESFKFELTERKGAGVFLS